MDAKVILVARLFLVAYLFPDKPDIRVVPEDADFNGGGILQ
jgi:hypothetical protein